MPDSGQSVDMVNSVNISFIDRYVAPDSAAIFILCPIHVMYPDGNPSKTHLDLHKAINWPRQWAKIGDFTRPRMMSQLYNCLDLTSV